MSSQTRISATRLVGSVCLTFLLAASVDAAQVAPTRKTKDLKEQLKSKLRPRTPAESAFIDRVVKMVDQNKLELRTVNSTFNWARRIRLRYRFPYFQRALQIEAAKKRVIVK